MQMNLKPGDHTVITTACTELDAVVVSVNRYEYGKTAGWEVVYDILGYGITQPYWYDDHTSFAEVRHLPDPEFRWSTCISGGMILNGTITVTRPR